jgi:hypothetical protein
LRYLIIRKIYNDSRRRVAPSYGFDLVPVVRHAWWSWLLDTGQLLAMSGALVSGLILGGPLAALLVACGVTIGALVRRAISITPSRTRPRAQRRQASDEKRKQRQRRVKTMLEGSPAIALTPLLASWVSGVPISTAIRPAGIIGVLVVACAVVIGVLRQLLLNALFQAETLRPGKLTRRERIIDEQQDHPCVIYTRHPHREDVDLLELVMHADLPSPFIGSGRLVNRWLPPMTVQLFRPGTGGMGKTRVRPVSIRRPQACGEAAHGTEPTRRGHRRGAATWLTRS